MTPTLTTPRTRPLLTLARVESALLLREPAAVGFTLGLPVLLLVLNGSRGNAPEPELGGAGPVDVMVPGLLRTAAVTVALERGLLRLDRRR